MVEVATALESLIEAIVESKEYREFQKQKEIMRERPALKQQIDEYRQRSFELQHSEDTEDLLERTEKFAEQYEDFRKNPLVEDFLNAELELCIMIQEINRCVVEAVEFE